jgi:phosphoglycolate phosphatase
MHKKILLFDFDGTIAETGVLAAEIYNDLAEQYNFNKITLNNFINLRNQTARQALKVLNIPLLKLPKILAQYRKSLSQKIKTVQVVAGMKEVLQRLAEMEYLIYIVTSNSVENVREFLLNNGINGIDQVYSETNYFGKYILIKKLIKQHNWEIKDVVYIGDEVRDIDSARRCGIKVAAVTWGYNSKQALSEANPDLLVDRPQQLTTLL